MSQFVRPRRGMTLVEIMVSMVLLLFVLGASTEFFRRQGTVVAQASGRLEAQQTAQFTLSLLDRELRLAGIGVADMQPTVVQAGGRAVTFNANLVSAMADDPSAVYVDRDADAALTGVFRSTQKRALPNSGHIYPESTYMKSVGAPSTAETIALWLSPDSSTALPTNDYILWRRVNNGASQLAARGIVLSAGEHFFEYFKPDTAGNPIPIPKSTLPLFHVATVHDSPADTGRHALVDSIHMVRVRVRVAFVDRAGTVERQLDHTIRLMNAGLIHRPTCGEPPLGVTPSAVAIVDTLGHPAVRITWSSSADETGGEADVERYGLYRRLAGATMGEPFASVPAGLSSYTFTDTDVRSGEQWVYGVTAVDCTPNSSGVTTTTAVTIP